MSVTGRVEHGATASLATEETNPAHLCPTRPSPTLAPSYLQPSPSSRCRLTSPPSLNLLSEYHGRLVHLRARFLIRRRGRLQPPLAASRETTYLRSRPVQGLSARWSRAGAHPYRRRRDGHRRHFLHFLQSVLRLSCSPSRRARPTSSHAQGDVVASQVHLEDVRQAGEDGSYAVAECAFRTTARRGACRGIPEHHRYPGAGRAFLRGRSRLLDFTTTVKS